MATPKLLVDAGREFLERQVQGAEPFPEDQRGDAWEGVPDDPPRTTWPEAPAAEAYHGLAGEIVARIKPQTEADPVAILAQFLAAFGSAIGRNAYYPVGPRRHYGNLFVVLVGTTAKARKGTAWSWVESLFPDHVAPDWMANRIQSGLSSGEGLIASVRDEVRREGAILQEAVTDKRLLVIEEEFGTVLRQTSRDGNILSQVMRQAWDGGRLRTMTKNSPLRATDAHISLVGHITREELLACLSASDKANGFANRVLWIASKRWQLLPDGGELLDLTLLQRKIAVAIDFAESTGRLLRDQAARTLWHQAYPRLTADVPGILGFVTARAEAQVLRLSCLYALLDHSPAIEAVHVQAALALWDYAERTCRWVFGESTGNDVADEILEALRGNPQGLVPDELFKLFGRHLSASRLRAALELLSDSHLVFSTTSATGGRPSKRWFASPRGCEKSEKSEKSCATRTYDDNAS